jgi:hypothetical protein
MRLAEVIPPGQSNNLPAVPTTRQFRRSRNTSRKLPRFPCRTIFGFCGGIAGKSSPSCDLCLLTAVVSARLQAHL